MKNGGKIIGTMLLMATAGLAYLYDKKVNDGRFVNKLKMIFTNQDIIVDLNNGPYNTLDTKSDENKQNA